MPIMNASSISKLIKTFISKEDDTLQPNLDLVLDALNHVEVKLNESESSCLSNCNFVTTDLFTSLIDLLLYDDKNCQRIISKPIITLFSKIMRLPLLRMELKNTYKIHLALCSFFNECFLLLDDYIITEVLSMIFYCTCSTIEEDLGLLRTTVLNLISNVKNSKHVAASLGCLRNLFIQTSILSSLCSMENKSFWSFFKMLSHLVGCDNHITAIYARTIILVLVSRHSEFERVFPSASKVVFLEESMFLIKTSIKANDLKRKEASLTLGIIILDTNLLKPKIHVHLHSVVDIILLDLSALDEANCNTNATFKLLLRYLKHFPENSSIIENGVFCESLINWSQRDVWTCGDLPARSLQLMNQVFMNSLKLNEDDKISGIANESQILSSLAKTLMIEVKYKSFGLVDKAHLKMKYEALCLLSTLFAHRDLRSSIPNEIFKSLQLTLDPCHLDSIASNRRALEASVCVFLEGVKILENIWELLPAQLRSLHATIQENSHWPRFVSKGLSSGSPSLVNTSLHIFSSASRLQSSNNSSGETSYSAVDQSPLFNTLVKELSTVLSSKVHVTKHLVHKEPMFTDSSIGIESTSKKFKDVLELKGEHMMQEQLRLKNLEVKELKEIISSNIVTLNKFQKRFAESECSTERNNEMVMDCFGQLQAACTEVHNLESRLQNKTNLLNDKGEEVFKLKKISSAMEKEMHRKDDQISREKIKIGQLEAELVNFKHDLAKLKEFDQINQRKITSLEERSNDIELQNTSLLRDQVNNENEIKELKSKIESLKNELKEKDDCLEIITKDLEEKKRMVDTVTKLLSGKKPV